MITPTPTVFLPALLCNDGLYQDVIDALAGQIDAQVVIASRPRIADSVAEILERAPAEFVLVGTSYGGNLAMEVALAAPGRVTALWLMGCDPGEWPSDAPDLIGNLESNSEAVIGELTEIAVHKNTAATTRYKSMAEQIGPAIGVMQARALTTRADVRTRLAQLTMPVLLLWGEHDALVSPSTGQALADALPRGQFEQLADCGHLPTLERPAESAALFGTFLRDSDRR